MSVLSLSRLAVTLVPIACVIAACSSSSSSGSGSASSGTGGTRGAGGASPLSDLTATTSGFGYSDAAPPLPDGPLHCMGDAAEWKALTDGPMPCQSGEDCCVITNPCRGEAQIVLATHQKEAASAWHYCSTECNDCVARPIEVACINSSCLGRVVAKPPPEQVPLESPLRHDHCGSAVEFNEITVSGKTGVHFWPNGCGMQDKPDGGP